MTRTEMNRRLATMTVAQIRDIEWYIRQGFGAHGIKCETPFSLKQINAVFESYHLADKLGEEALRDGRSEHDDWSQCRGVA